MRTISKTLVFIAFVSFTTLFLVADPTQKKECTETEARSAIDQSDQLKDWKSAYEFFKRFRHCDDGAIAEGFSDSVAKLLANSWDHVGVLDSLISKDKAFGNFVFRHIDETADRNDLKAIVRNAKLRCPSGKQPLCRSLERQAGSSLRNQAKIGIESKPN